MTDHSTCEHPHPEQFDKDKQKRYKCNECGVLLYRRRQNTPLRTYQCKYVEKVDAMTQDGKPTRRRIYTCPEPATHFGANEHAYCKEHGHARVSKSKLSKAQQAERARKAQAKADQELADRVIAEAREREATNTDPVRSVESDPDRLGGVFFF